MSEQNPTAAWFDRLPPVLRNATSGTRLLQKGPCAIQVAQWLKNRGLPPDKLRILDVGYDPQNMQLRFAVAPVAGALLLEFHEIVLTCRDVPPGVQPTMERIRRAITEELPSVAPENIEGIGPTDELGQCRCTLKSPFVAVAPGRDQDYVEVVDRAKLSEPQQGGAAAPIGVTIERAKLEFRNEVQAMRDRAAPPHMIANLERQQAQQLEELRIKLNTPKAPIPVDRGAPLAKFSLEESMPLGDAREAAKKWIEEKKKTPGAHITLASFFGVPNEEEPLWRSARRLSVDVPIMALTAVETEAVNAGLIPIMGRLPAWQVPQSGAAVGQSKLNIAGPMPEGASHFEETEEPGRVVLYMTADAKPAMVSKAQAFMKEKMPAGTAWDVLRIPTAYGVRLPGGNLHPLGDVKPESAKLAAETLGGVAVRYNPMDEIGSKK